MGNLSKYDVLNLLSKKMPFFAATQWLKNPHPEFDGKAPSDLMKQGEIKALVVFYRTSCLPEDG